MVQHVSTFGRRSEAITTPRVGIRMPRRMRLISPPPTGCSPSRLLLLGPFVPHATSSLEGSSVRQRSSSTRGAQAMFEGFDRLRVKTTEAEIDAVKKGSGPPLLLIHGYPQTKAMWHKVAPGL